MELKGIKNIGFWARELRLPLFWLTDKNLKIFAQDTLIIYKKSIIHIYYLNDKSLKGSKLIYNYFIQPKNLLEYESNCKKIIILMRNLSVKSANIKVRNIADIELNEKFKEIFKALNAYTAIYTKTEPLYMVKIDEQEKKLKNTIKKLSELRFELRKEGEVLFYILLGILVKELGRRNNIKVADLFFYTYEELVDLLDQNIKVSTTDIKERSKGYVLVSLNKGYKIYTGKIFRSCYKEIVLDPAKTKVIKGNVAMRGRARGRVRLILHNRRNIQKEVNSFKKGEILVTEMTRPDVVMACRKEAAIVTDEGGITSHAAIISRELKIPCIIATHNATQVLKTGDLVDVDADKGIVRKL